MKANKILGRMLMVLLTLAMLMCVVGCAKTEPKTIANDGATTISGVWRFNDSLNMYEATNEQYDAERRSQNVNFTSNGKKYGRMYWTHVETGVALLKDLYYTAPQKSSDVPWSYNVYQEGHNAFSHNQWVSDEYRTVDFGAEPQEVSEVFFKWLTTNATQQ